jgi:hypothetical protein
MAVRLALAGDTMLGRRAAERLAADPEHALLLAADLAAIAREADCSWPISSAASPIAASRDGRSGARRGGGPRARRAGGRRPRVRIAAARDHPSEYAAAIGRPGIAFAELHQGVPAWLGESAAHGPDADVVVVAAHWGRNMRARRLEHVRRRPRRWRRRRR